MRARVWRHVRVAMTVPAVTGLSVHNNPIVFVVTLPGRHGWCDGSLARYETGIAAWRYVEGALAAFFDWVG